MSPPDDPLRQFLGVRVARGRMPGATWWVGRGGRAFNGTQVTDADLVHLKSLPRLRTLYLYNTRSPTLAWST